MPEDRDSIEEHEEPSPRLTIARRKVDRAGDALLRWVDELGGGEVITVVGAARTDDQRLASVGVIAVWHPRSAGGPPQEVEPARLRVGSTVPLDVEAVVPVGRICGSRGNHVAPANEHHGRERASAERRRHGAADRGRLGRALELEGEVHQAGIRSREASVDHRGILSGRQQRDVIRHRDARNGKPPVRGRRHRGLAGHAHRGSGDRLAVAVLRHSCDGNPGIRARTTFVRPAASRQKTEARASERYQPVQLVHGLLPPPKCRANPSA